MATWDEVTPISIFDMTVKMHRPLFEAGKVLTIANQGWEFDHYAYKYLGSESEMYKILDTNFGNYFEERGDLSRLPSIIIPVTQK